MDGACSAQQLSLEFGVCRDLVRGKSLLNLKTRGKLCFLGTNLPSISLKQYSFSRNVSKRIHKRVRNIQCKYHACKCLCFINPGTTFDPSSVKNATLTLARSFKNWHVSPVTIKLASAVGIAIFAIWGLAPLARLGRNIFLNKSDSSWRKSSTYHVTISYIQPLILWAGAIFICRTLDPLVLPTEASQIVKQRLINFTRSLSTVLALAYCLSSVIQQVQKFMERDETIDTRNMGFQFAGKAVYTAVWVAAVSLFMELLGFSTQKWLTAGGLGTVLLTLAGREIFTNFLSSAMLHATRPFIVNEWIQTKIEGYEVSGTVEHVGWWSPTIVRGEDREAVHIPNHKFTVNVVRNLTQKTHWRIKTHLAISHLDVRKINIIVADMRKVLAKNPQVEQQKLHRRVFLDNINPENQALMILVSCFVKTSHFEEYLCVKEAIFMDLLRVIRHHRARLATPIRTVQKAYTDPDLDDVPYADSIFSREASPNRPLLLIEPSYKINGEDKAKPPQARSMKVNGDEDSKATAGRSTPDSSSMDAKVDANSDAESKSQETMPTFVNPNEMVKADTKADAKEISKVAEKSISSPKLDVASAASKAVPQTDTKPPGTLKSNANGSTGLTQNMSNNKQPSRLGQESTSSSSPESSGSKKVDSVSTTAQPKQDTKQQATQPGVSKPSLEENIVLGVALDGPKRTLPIEEDMVPLSNPEDAKEMAARRGGNGPALAEKVSNDIKESNPPVSEPSDISDLKD